MFRNDARRQLYVLVARPIRVQRVQRVAFMRASLAATAAAVTVTACGSPAGVTYRGHSHAASSTLVVQNHGHATLTLTFTRSGASIRQKAGRLQKLNAFCAWSVKGTSDRGMAVAMVQPSAMRSRAVSATWAGPLPQAHDYSCGLRDGSKPEGVSSSAYIAGALLAVEMPHP